MEMLSIHWIDVLVIVLYLGGMLAAGTYFMKRQTSTSEYLLASRSVGWFAIGLSLLSSLNSAMDYVVGPAAFLEWGLILGLILLPPVLAFPFVFRVFIPFYQRLNVYNCYEYLEHRFDVRVRVTTSVIFVIWRICWMGFTIYLPAYVLNVALGLPLIETVIVLGVITTAYTTLGGARAVVWTDVIQAVIMFSGVIMAIVLLVSSIPGGLYGAWETAEKAGLVHFTANIPGWNESSGLGEKISLYFHYPITFWSIVCAGIIGKLNNYGSDQVMIQRYLSARSLSDCQIGFVTNVFAYLIYVVLFMVLGMSLLAYFQHYPLQGSFRYEYCFPYFIGYRMPIVIKGLMLVAIYSAAQSSVSAGISASASVLYTNVYLRLGNPGDDSEAGSSGQSVRFTRLCALALGTAVTLLAYHIKGLGELFPLANRIVANFAGVMIPVFLLGMFSKRAKSLGVAIGAICGVIVMFVWGFGHDLGIYEEAMGYGWTSTVGFFTTVIVCYLVSFFEKTPPPEKSKWLWRNVMQRPTSTGETKSENGI